MDMFEECDDEEGGNDDKDTATEDGDVREGDNAECLRLLFFAGIGEAGLNATGGAGAGGTGCTGGTEARADARAAVLYFTAFRRERALGEGGFRVFFGGMTVFSI